MRKNINDDNGRLMRSIRKPTYVEVIFFLLRYDFFIGCVDAYGMHGVITEQTSEIIAVFVGLSHYFLWFSFLSWYWRCC